MSDQPILRGKLQFEEIPEEVREFLRRTMNATDERGDYFYDYADNARICIVGDKEGERKYEEFREQGCCGFYDEEIEYKGVKYKIGFNYGH